MTATRLKFIMLMVVSATMIALVALHVNHLNGPYYWKWLWRDATTIPPTPLVRWYAAMLCAAAPIIIAWFVPSRGLSIVLLMIGVIAIKLVSISIDARPPNFTKLAGIVRSPEATSYFSDASALANFEGWLRDYPEILPSTQLHTQSKPPGAVAYYMLFIRIRAFGYSERAAIVAGIVQAILAALSIPAVYGMILVLTSDAAMAHVGAILMALCPGFLIIYPSFDAILPIFAAAMIISWHLALVRNDWRWALSFGVILAVTCFFTYNLLTLGAFLLAWTVLRGRGARVATLVVTALSTCSLIYVLMWLFTGFNPIETFLAAYRNQHSLLERFISQRPYPATIWYDLVDFALSAGWIVVLLAAFGFARAWHRPHRSLVIVCLAMPLLVAAIGLLQAETARVWNFMLPLLILPAAIELVSWPREYRVATYSALLLIALVIGREMIFMMA